MLTSAPQSDLNVAKVLPCHVRCRLDARQGPVDLERGVVDVDTALVNQDPDVTHPPRASARRVVAAGGVAHDRDRRESHDQATGG